MDQKLALESMRQAVLLAAREATPGGKWIGTKLVCPACDHRLMVRVEGRAHHPDPGASTLARRSSPVPLPGSCDVCVAGLLDTPSAVPFAGYG